MSLSKRLLALFLVFVLAFSLALPAFAEGEPEEPNPAMPVITVQPQGGRIRLGQKFTLSVQAHIPNGDEIEYIWYHSRRIIDMPSSNELVISGDYAGTNEYSIEVNVEVINKANPEYSVTSETARVEVYLTPYDQFMMSDFGNTAMGVLLFPFAPLAFLLWWFVLPALSYPIDWIRNLFQ